VKGKINQTVTMIFFPKYYIFYILLVLSFFENAYAGILDDSEIILWAFGLIAVILFAFAYMILKFKINKIRHDNILLEEKVNQRSDQLIRVKKYVENIIETAGDIIITINQKREILTWNKEAANVFGFTKEEVIGKPIKMIEHAKDVFHFDDFINLVQNSEEIKQQEIRKISKDGKEIELLLAINHFQDPFDDNSGYTLVLSDISERNRLQENLLNREKLLDGIDAMQILLGTLSHYINNSVTAIFSLAQLSEIDSKFNEKLIATTKDQIAKIKAVLNGLSKLVNKLNLKTTDYSGKKVKIIDIEKEIMDFVKKIKENKISINNQKDSL